MNAWPLLPFEDVVADESAGNEKTPQSEFLVAGQYAIVDQGKELIAGYTNEKSRLCRAQLPVIVFGDHTRCFKYVDFPFCMGADGIKVLRPKVEIEPRYLYHYLRQIRLTEAGYGRHFKYLRRTKIVVPPVPEQRRIAEILDKADALLAKRRAAIAELDSLTQSIFLDMFGDPIRNPHQLPVRQMIDLVDATRPISYGILMPGPQDDDGVPYVRVVDMRRRGIVLSGIRRTSQAISDTYRRSLLRAGDLLMSIRGHVGRLAVVPRELEGANITQDTARLAISAADPIFVQECLRTPGFQRWMARHTKGVAVRGINLTDVKRMPIPVASEKRQRDFSRRACAVNELLRTQRDALLQMDELFGSLQHRAFTNSL